MANAAFGGGAEPRAEVPEVVGVGARHHGGQPFPSRHLSEDVVQLGLAVVTAIRTVAAVTVASQLARGHGPVLDPDRACDLPGAVELSGCERRRDGGHGDGVGAEDAVADGGHERRVDAAGESNHDSAGGSDRGLQLSERRHRAPARRPARAPRYA